MTVYDMKARAWSEVTDQAAARAPDVARRICVLGVGRIGAITAVGLAHLGHDVTGIDLSARRLAELNGGGEALDAEPGLFAALRNARRFRHLRFAEAAESGAAEFAVLCVDTPGLPSGAADLRQVEAATADAARMLQPGGVLVTRSTVPVGTGEHLERLLEGYGRADVRVVHVPEFLREGRAWEDFREPDRIVVGADDATAGERVSALMAPLDRPIIRCDRRTAEIAKYAANAFLAMSISFANEMADLAAALGTDVNAVAAVLRADRRIGPSAYLVPGLGFGGHCLPKDVDVLVGQAAAAGVEAHVLSATRRVNRGRIGQCRDWLASRLGGLAGRRVALIGLAFKPGVDDLRASPSLHLVERLVADDARVVAWDPLVRQAPASVIRAKTIGDALDGADALVVAHQVDTTVAGLTPSAAAAAMRGRVVYDAPAILDRREWCRAGFELSSGRAPGGSCGS